MILYLISSLRFLPLLLSQNPISDEFPPVDPTSNKSPPANLTSNESITADPTFDESPPSTSAANLVNTTAPEPHHSHQVSTLPSHLREFLCFFAFATLHEPHTFHEASSDPLWQQAGKSAIGCK